MKQLIAKQQVRFLLAGCFNTGLDFLLLNILIIGFGAPQLIANSISVTVGICISYGLNHFFVFRHPEPIRLGMFLKFFAVTGFSSLILQNAVIFGFETFFDSDFGNSLLLFAGRDGREFVAINSAKVVAVALGLVWNFTMYRVVVFRRPRGIAVDADQDAGRARSRLSDGPDADPVP